MGRKDRQVGTEKMETGMTERDAMVITVEKEMLNRFFLKLINVALSWKMVNKSYLGMNSLVKKQDTEPNRAQEIPGWRTVGQRSQPLGSKLLALQL